MKHVCPKCGEERDVESEFRWRNEKRGIRQQWCKYCQAEANRLHYQNNKQIYKNRAIERSNRLTTENRQKLHDYLSAHACADCGSTDTSSLHFVPIQENKATSIASMTRNATSWQVIEDELTRYKIRCKKCQAVKNREAQPVKSPDKQASATKICNMCGVERDAEKDFSWEYKNRGIRHDRCKYCQAELSKLHYQNNKHVYNERSRIRKAQTATTHEAYISSYLSAHPCIDCGQTDIRILDFDHVKGQKFREIADLLSWGIKWSTIEAEIAKCEVRCVKCHRIKTIEQGRGWRSTQPLKQPVSSYRMVHAYLTAHPCIDCGEADIRVLEFDHIHNTKLDDISHMLSQGCGWLSIATEIAKCEVRCASCHRIKTIERRDARRSL